MIGFAIAFTLVYVCSLAVWLRVSIDIAMELANKSQSTINQEILASEIYSTKGFQNGRRPRARAIECTLSISQGLDKRGINAAWSQANRMTHMTRQWPFRGCWVNGYSNSAIVGSIVRAVHYTLDN